MPDRHTLRLRDGGGSEANSYKVAVTGDERPEFIDTGNATINPNDNIYMNNGGNWVAHGRLYGGEDAFLYNGKRVRVVLEFEDRTEMRVNDDDWKPASAFGEVNQRTDWPRDDGGSGVEQPVDQPDDMTAPEVDTPVEADGLRFENVALAVDDLGMDPDGNEDISGRLERVADDHTLVRFPKGDFRFANQTIIEGLAHFGIVGQGGDDTRFVVPQGFGERLIIREGTGVRFEGIGWDQTASGAHPGMWLSAADDLIVEDIALHGRGIHHNSTFAKDTGNPEETNALSIGVTSESGEGIVRDLHFVNGGQMRNHHYGNSRVGVWGLNAHRGTLDFVDCRVEEFPNNGYYTSSCPGVIRIRGGRVRNNTVSQMRIATEGSIVEDCLIEYDADGSNARDPMTPGHGTQGVAFDSGKVRDGAVVRNCTIRMKKHAAGRGAICVWSRSGHHEVHGCDIVVDEAAQSGGEAVSAISCEPPDFYDVNHHDVSVVVSQVSVSGSASSGESIFVRDRPLIMDDVCVSQGRTPIRAKECSPNINNSSLNARLCPVRTDDSDGSDKPESPNQKRHTFRIKGESGGGRKQYILRLEQDGTIKQERRAEDPDYVHGPAVFGEVMTGSDEYVFEGEIEGFLTVGGPVKTFVDGTEVNPWEVGESLR
jgi:hypothetical protein